MRLTSWAGVLSSYPSFYRTHSDFRFNEFPIIYPISTLQFSSVFTSHPAKDLMTRLREFLNFLHSVVANNRGALVTLTTLSPSSFMQIAAALHNSNWQVTYTQKLKKPSLDGWVTVKAFFLVAFWTSFWKQKKVVTDQKLPHEWTNKYRWLNFQFWRECGR